MAMLLLCGKTLENSKYFAWLTEGFYKSIHARDAWIDIRTWPDVGNPDDIEFVLTWHYPEGELQKYPNLKVISLMGAGVDHIFKDPHFPKHIPVVRLVDPTMAHDMALYIVACVLYYTKRFNDWDRAKLNQEWFRPYPCEFNHLTVGILGYGNMGKAAGKTLQKLGIKTIGWSRSHNTDLKTFLNQTNILVCTLPLTKETKYILNKDLFSQLPKNSYLINCARGDHLNEKDLLEALDNGQLTGATLDVFPKEPLPADHPFWSHPKIRITPHVSAVTNPETCADQVIDNYYRAIQNKSLLNQVDLERQY